jgi:hypothetical protein
MQLNKTHNAINNCTQVTLACSLLPIPREKQINVSEGNLPRRLSKKASSLPNFNKRNIKERERKTVSRYKAK